MLSRKVYGFEYFYVKSSLSFNQLVLEPTSLSKQERVIDLIKQRTLGLKCSYRDEDKHVLVNKDYAPIKELPKSVKTMDDVALYMQSHLPDTSKNIADIWANDKFVGLNVNHMAGDGTFLNNLHEAIANDADIEPVSGLPIPPEISFSKEMSEYDGYVGMAHNDRNIPRVMGKFKSVSEASRNISFELDHSELSCFDKKTQRLRGLTENLWTAAGLSASAFNGTLGPFGGSTCYDLRRSMKNAGWNVCDHIANIDVSVRGTSETKISELMRLEREDFNRRIANKYYIGYLRTVLHINTELGVENIEDAPQFAPAPGSGVEVSSFGSLRPRGPIRASLVSASSEEIGAADVTSFACYSHENEEGKKFIAVIESSEHDMNQQEAERFAELMKKSLTRVVPTMTISEAIKAISEK